MSKIDLNKISKKKLKNKTDKKQNEIYFENTNNGYIQEDKEVTVINCGKDMIIKATSNKAKNIGQWRRTKDGYMENTITNIRKKIKNNEEKSSGGITKAMTRLKGILRNNFDGSNNELFVTLTCENETTDIDTINGYFKKFFKKLKSKFYGLEYVYVLEKHKKR